MQMQIYNLTFPLFSGLAGAPLQSLSLSDIIALVVTAHEMSHLVIRKVTTAHLRSLIPLVF